MAGPEARQNERTAVLPRLHELLGTCVAVRQLRVCSLNSARDQMTLHFSNASPRFWCFRYTGQRRKHKRRVLSTIHAAHPALFGYFYSTSAMELFSTSFSDSNEPQRITVRRLVQQCKITSTSAIKIFGFGLGCGRLSDWLNHNLSC